jgi:RNAse (barnase) inhibitor barstar
MIQIDGDNITDWDSFHSVFSKAFGFPDFYGRNMNAWNDCMTYLDDPDAGMSTVHVEPGEILVLQINNAPGLKKRCPEQFAAIVECSAFVNWRRIEKGEPTILALSYYV